MCYNHPPWGIAFTLIFQGGLVVIQEAPAGIWTKSLCGG